MLKSFLRAILAINGLLALAVSAAALLDPAKVAGQLGLTPNGPLGFATFRADIGGLFAGAGFFMLLAAITTNRTWLIPPLVFTGLALSIRVGSLAMFGIAPGLLQPITVEAVTFTLVGAAFFAFDRG